jgi:DNA-binding HxlR family transcriptional regulator
MSHSSDAEHATEIPERPTDATPAPETLLDVFSDEYARDILEAMQDESKSARALTETCDMSRPTVYRRLNRLSEAGLITEEIAVGSDGHHRRRFAVTVENVGISLGDAGFDADIAADGHQPVTRG